MVLPGLCLGFVFATAAAQEAHIPSIRTFTLSGAPITLPDGLHGKTGVLIIGFSTGARDSVTAWAKRIATDYSTSSSILYYEMPVLASVPRLLRGYVSGKIKESIPPVAQPRCIFIESDESGWKQAAAFGNADDAYVLVVDQAGLVKWHMAGPLTPESYAALRHQLDPPPAAN